MLWSYGLNDPNHEIRDIGADASDHVYYLYGAINGYDSAQNNAYLEKRDPDGTISYTADLFETLAVPSTASNLCQMYGLTVTDEGECYFFAGLSANNRIYQGNVKAGASGSVTALASGVPALGDRGFIRDGYIFGVQGNKFRKLDMDGALQWEKTLPNNSYGVVDMDGSAVLYHGVSNFKTIMRYDMDTGTSAAVYTQADDIFAFVCGEPGQLIVGGNGKITGVVLA